jgi:hypothetical protein
VNGRSILRGHLRGSPEEVPQVLGRVASSRVPLGSPLGKRLQANSLELLWDCVVDLSRRAGFGTRDLPHELLVRTSPKWAAADQ